MGMRVYGFETTAVVTLMVLVSCGGSVVVDMSGSTTGGGGSPSTSTSTGSGCGEEVTCCSDADCISGGVCDTTTFQCMDPPGETCRQCACMLLLSMGGCADKCAMGTNGTATPNFCDGVPALSQCAACLKDRCHDADTSNPASCM